MPTEPAELAAPPVADRAPHDLTVFAGRAVDPSAAFDWVTIGSARPVGAHRAERAGSHRPVFRVRDLEPEPATQHDMFGPLRPLMSRPDITAIMVNGPRNVYVERDGRTHAVRAGFDDDDHLRRTIEQIIGRRVDESAPFIETRLPDGARVTAVLPPVALNGPTLTIRKFADDPIGMDDLVAMGTLDAGAAELLADAVRHRRNVVITGRSGAGKTTFLNVLSSFVPSHERIVTVEEIAELRLPHDNVVRLEGGGTVTAQDLLRNALRMRPDRIVIGEVRDGSALEVLRAVNAGHDGTMLTLRASSPTDALVRLETMALTARTELPRLAVREVIAAAIDLVVHLDHRPDGTRRVRQIAEVVGVQSDAIILRDLLR